MYRNPDVATVFGDMTSDVIMDKMKWEFKRISSPHVSKIAIRVTKKLDKQGTRYVVDLSTSKIERSSAETKIAWLLEDPGIEEVLLIKSGSVKMFKK